MCIRHHSLGSTHAKQNRQPASLSHCFSCSETNSCRPLETPLLMLGRKRPGLWGEDKQAPLTFCCHSIASLSFFCRAISSWAILPVSSAISVD